MIKLEELPTSRKKFDCQEDVKRLSCAKCGFSSYMLPSLIQHKEAGCGNRTDNLSFLRNAYKCRNCEFVSCSCIIMSRHETRCCNSSSRTNRISWWICSHCEFTISYKSVHLDITKFECGGESCTDTYASLEELKEHATFVHLPRECLKFLFANDCMKTKSIEQFFSEHGQEFVSEMELNEDKIDEHSPVDAWVFDEREFKRKRTFKLSVSNIIKHSETEDGTWLFCHSCEYKTKHKRNLSRHMKTKHQSASNVDIQWFECQECEYKSKTKQDLHKHKISKHTPSENIKWFECQECPYRSKIKHNVKIHKIYQHTASENVKWFECQECEYKSKTNQNLKLHNLYQHTASENIKWLECQECEYKSKTKRDLKRHKINQHTPAANVK